MDIIQAIKERRSINFFNDKEILSDDVIRELIEIANLSPSSFSLQPWKVIIVKNLERKKVLRKCAFNQPKVEEASAVFILIADPQGVEENLGRVLDSWQELGYMKPEMRETYEKMTKTLYGDPDSLKRKIFAVKNTALFGMNLMLAAKGFKLETHPMDGFDEECIKKEFNIPEDKIIPMIIAVGILNKGVSLLPRSFRRKFEEFAKFE